MKDKKGIKLTYVGVWHFIRLTYRSVLFVLLLIGYIRYRFINGTPLIIGTEKLCGHKRQLHSLWKQVEQYTKDRMKRLEN